MTPEQALRKFMATYGTEAVESIVELERDPSMASSLFVGPMVTESCDSMKEFIAGYCRNRIEHPDTRIPDNLLSSWKECTDKELLTEKSLWYNKASSLVADYIDQLGTMPDTVSMAQGQLLENGLGGETLGMVTDIVNQFTESLSEKVHDTMDRLLLASGYTSRQRLAAVKPLPKKEPVFFL